MAQWIFPQEGVLEARGMSTSVLMNLLWLVKRTDKSLSVRSSILETPQRCEWEKNGIKKAKQRHLSIISVVSVGHFGDFCRSFQWSLSIISVALVVLLMCFVDIRNLMSLYLSVIQQLNKIHEKRINRGRTTPLANNAKIRPIKCQFIQQLHFLPVTSLYRTGNDLFLLYYVYFVTMPLLSFHHDIDRQHQVCYQPTENIRCAVNR